MIFSTTRRLSLYRRALLLATALAASPVLAAPPVPEDDFHGVTGPFVPGTYGDRLLLSADGSVFVVINPGFKASLWSPTGLAQIPDLTNVLAVSADGSKMLVYSPRAVGIWRDGEPIIDLPALDSNYQGSLGFDAMSASGNAVVGYSRVPGTDPSGSYYRPTLWTIDYQTGTSTAVDSGLLPGNGNYGRAQSVSANGLVVAGYQQGLFGGTNITSHVFRWEKDKGLLDLGLGEKTFMSGDGSVIVSGNWRWVGDATGGTHTRDITFLPGADYVEIAAMSADGTTVVGKGMVSYPIYRAFRWIAGVGGVDLGTLGNSAGANAVSADGSIVVGWSNDASNVQHAIRWNAAGDLKKIADLLTAGGVDIADWQLKEATAVSADGNTIVGWGSKNSVTGAWIARCASVCAITTPETTAASFSGLGGMGATASTFAGTETDAVAGMASSARDAAISAFAYGAFDSDPTTSAIIGASYGLGNDLAVAASIGLAGIETLLPYGGTAMFTGPAVSVALTSKPDAGFNWLIGGSLVGLNGTVNRGYLNGNTPVTSSGETSGSGASLTGQVGFTFNDLIADTLVTPFVSVTVSSVSFAGYTETTGPFPATFQPFTTSSALLRLGTEFSREFAPGSTFTAGLSYGHNFGNGGTVTGAGSGFAMSVPGAAPISDFVEASVGLDMPLSERVDFSGRLAAILPLTGAPASIQARAGFKMSF